MKITSWNVNSVKARHDHVLRYLDEASPDVLMIQELKMLEMPTMEFEGAGYTVYAVGQKTYNGVALLSKAPLNILAKSLPGDDGDEQARYIEAETKDGLRLINIYLPNGNPVDTEKYPYKLGWMDRLYDRLKELREARIPFLIGGDFNIIPEDRDCYDPAAWANDALFKLESREKFRALEALGLYDAFRINNQQASQYTFWDYQGGAWPADRGIRIDHFLLSPPLADRLIACSIDKNPRGWEKPSDHTPIMIEIE